MSINIISRYSIFCKVVELGSFTKTAEAMGFTQSSVSQSVKTLEEELGTTLVNRKTGAISLTKDGRQYYPFILSIYNAERLLEQKNKEMSGLEDAVISIGTFTGISRTVLPAMMRDFQREYPSVTFELAQDNYDGIHEMIKDGTVDFGFTNSDYTTDLDTVSLYKERLMAVLPPDHPLADKDSLELSELALEPYIQLSEGERNVAREAFSKKNLTPDIRYNVMDDYTILAMVREGLGISMIYERTLKGYSHDLPVRPIRESPSRTIALAWNNWSTMPQAARLFAQFIMNHCSEY
jgi:DNA-binding transcriptional LysR family regulator